MKIPNKLDILGQDFKIKKMKSLSDENGQVLCGCSIAVAQEIHINTSFPQEVQECTLIHEIVETLNTMLELELPHPTISSLETGLYQVLKTNKLLK